MAQKVLYEFNEWAQILMGEKKEKKIECVFFFKSCWKLLFFGLKIDLFLPVKSITVLYCKRMPYWLKNKVQHMES